MLTEQTLDKMNAMKLSGMADALKQQLGAGDIARLSFEDRLGLLIDSEWTAREQRKLTKRLHSAKLRYAASLEDVDFKHPRGLDRQQVLSLGSCSFVEHRHNLLISGPTGIGKSYLACAFVERACRRGYNAAYLRLPSTIGSSPPCATASAVTWSRSSRIEANGLRHSLPASSRPRTGTPASEIPTWPTPSATAWCTTRTASS